MSSTIVYVQAGGFGTRLAPLIHQPGMGSLKTLAPTGRNLLPLNHNAYYAAAKPVLPYFGVALSEPLIRDAVCAGIDEVRMTIHNLPETVVGYYKGRDLGRGKSVTKFLYEMTPLDTAGGIVRDVVSGIRDGTIKSDNTILILGGDIRTDLNIADFLGAHGTSHSDISILLASAPRVEMCRFGAAVRQGDKSPVVGTISVQAPISLNKTLNLSVFGNYELNGERMARIERFYEKLPRLKNPGEVEDDKGRVGKILDAKGVDMEKVLREFGKGALSPTNLQNGSVCAMRAELIAQLAPLVFNLSPDDSARAWAETEDINISGPAKFSDFGSDWFMALTSSKPLPLPYELSPTAELQARIIEDLRAGLPQIFGFRHEGNWSDDGTLEAVLAGHFEILKELAGKGRNAGWPIPWDKVKLGYPHGIITMSHLDLRSISITPPVFIGSNVIVQSGAEIGPYAIIGNGWEISGHVERSVLFHKRLIDIEMEAHRGWQRFSIAAQRQVVGSVIGSGLELTAIDHNGAPVKNPNSIVDSVVVSNGSQNVISPITI